MPNDIGSIVGQLQIIPALVVEDDTQEKARYNTSGIYSNVIQVAFGTAPGQANKQIQEEVSVVNGVPRSLDLEDGTEKNSFGGDFDANNIKYVLIHHKPTSLATQIDLSGNFLTANNLSTASLKPGESMVMSKMALGVTTIAATSDALVLTNPDATQTADIQFLILGDDL